MEVLGAVSGAVGLLAVTLKTARGVSRIIGEIKDAPQSLQRLGQEISDLESILTQIGRIDSEESIFSILVETSLKTCRDELERLQSLLQPLAPKSAEDGIHRRTCQGLKKFMKDDDIKDAVNSLQSRKLSILLALMALLTSKQLLHVSEKKSVQATCTTTEWNDGENTADRSPGPQLLRGATAFKHDRQIKIATSNVSTGRDISAGGCQQATMFLEKFTTQTIERTMRKIQEEFLLEPSARIDGVLKLNPMETQQLWETNLKSIKEFRVADFERKREDFLQSIPFPDYHNDKIKAKIAQSGTCEWIFDHPQYKAWQEDRFSSVLHAMGKPGSGKTVLSRHVLSTLQGVASAGKCQVLYCFCNNRDNPNQTATDILGAMIHQFIYEKNSLFPDIVNRHSGILKKISQTDSSPWSLESLWEIFLILVESAGLGVVYCIIDALDECEAESVSDLLSLISNEMTNSGEHSGGKIKLFLTSRPFERLEVELDHKVVRIISITPDIINKDIEKIVNDGMEKLKKRLSLKEEVKDRLSALLVDRSEGMFLWVLLAMKQLNRAKFVTPQKLEKRINDLPNGLDGIYDKMLEGLIANISDPDELRLIRKMISWVVLAQRPLTIAEFRVAMAIELDSCSLESIDNVSGEGAQESGMADAGEPREDEYEDPTATVRLIHQSAKDYFFDKEKRLSPQLSEFRIDEKRGNSEIASMCLTYLLFKDFGTGPIQLAGESGDRGGADGGKGDADGGVHTDIASGDSDSPPLHQMLTRFKANNPFLEYATLTWAYHARRSFKNSEQQKTVNPQIMRLICHFLKQPLHLKCWFQLYCFLANYMQFYSKEVNALHISCLMDLPVIVEYILDNDSIDINEWFYGGGPPVLLAVQAGIESGTPDTLRTLLKRKPDLNLRDHYGRTPLNQAARNGHQVLMGLLLDQGADIDAANSTGWTALHYAATTGGANIDAIDENGWNALIHLIATEGDTDIAKLLLDRGSDIEIRAENNLWTPLRFAVSRGRRDMAELLLARGADIESKSHASWAALHFACKDGHRNIVELLLDRGARIEAINVGGSAALHMATANGHQDTVDLLLNKGADIERRTDTGDTALILAAKKGHHKLFQMLFKRMTDDQKSLSENAIGQRVIFLHAASHSNFEMMESLLNNRTSVNTLSSRASTALHVAASVGNIDVVNWLLEHGADPHLIDHSAWSPIICAWRSRHQTVVERLLEAGSILPGIDRIVTNTPTCWSKIDKSPLLGLCRENLFIKIPDRSSVRHSLRQSVRTDHCMPAEKDLFYYEVEIVELGDTGIICVGFCRDLSGIEQMPGWEEGTLGYHGDDGYLFSGPGTGKPYSEIFTKGDIIGCGVRFDQSTAFFTRNGKFLGNMPKDVSGQLYPMLGFEGPGAKVNSNFGHKPFLFQEFSLQREEIHHEKASWSRRVTRRWKGIKKSMNKGM